MDDSDVLRRACCTADMLASDLEQSVLHLPDLPLIHITSSVRHKVYSINMVNQPVQLVLCPHAVTLPGLRAEMELLR